MPDEWWDVKLAVNQREWTSMYSEKVLLQEESSLGWGKADEKELCFYKESGRTGFQHIRETTQGYIQSPYRSISRTCVLPYATLFFLKSKAPLHGIQWIMTPFIFSKLKAHNGKVLHIGRLWLLNYGSVPHGQVYDHVHNPYLPERWGLAKTHPFPFSLWCWFCKVGGLGSCDLKLKVCLT